MFKVGDWVTNDTNTTPVQIVQIVEDKIFIDKNDCRMWVGENCKLWQPKEGEWCWFYDNFGDAYLKKFKQMCPKVPTNYVSEQGLISEYVEPFIGKLPTFLKD